MNTAQQIVDELMAILRNENGVCPPPEQRTPEQRAVLARAGVLSLAVWSHAPDRFREATKTLALATPANTTPCSVAEIEAEASRQADAIAADMLRLFPREGQPAAAADVNPRGYNAEQRAALKRILTIGPSLDGAPSAQARSVRCRLFAKIGEINDRLGRHIGSGYADAIEAELVADAEQLISDLERLF